MCFVVRPHAALKGGVKEEKMNAVLLQDVSSIYIMMYSNRLYLIVLLQLQRFADPLQPLFVGELRPLTP